MTPLDLQPGDLIACFGDEWVSRLISLCTFSPLGPPNLFAGPSHIAIICEHNGASIWVESTTLCDHPCLIRGLHVRGSQAHWPEQRIRDYTVKSLGFVDVYRLSDIDRLSKDESSELTAILINQFVDRGLGYDYGGAAVSGTRAFKFTRLLPPADLEKLFCSELIAAVLMRLGRLNRDNPTRFNPATLLRRLVRTGTYRIHRQFMSSHHNKRSEMVIQ